jgi:hypothetical protein
MNWCQSGGDDARGQHRDTANRGDQDLFWHR